MVRRGSTVRVRQRALQKRRKPALFRWPALADSPACDGMEPLMEPSGSERVVQTSEIDAFAGTTVGPASDAAGLQESNGDELRGGFQSVSTHPIDRPRGEHHDRYLHLRRLLHPRCLRQPEPRHLGRYWGKQGPELLDHRLASFAEEQRLVFGAIRIGCSCTFSSSGTEESKCVTPGSP